jgi:pimeloyl-ACP methyl ester carboxylesterase
VATYVLIHGGGDVAWYWHLVEPELRKQGHDVVAPDLPCEDDSAGWSEYADTVVDAIGERNDLVVAAQSLGAFTAPIVSDRVPVKLIVLVAGMVPLPGETGDDWLANTGFDQAPRGRDPGEHDDPTFATFYHDVAPEIAAEALRRGRNQADVLQPWPLEAWPDVPTRFVLCRDDRLFPATWLREVVRDRLGVEPDEIDSGHTPALSHPKELAERLEAFRAEL